MPLGYIRDLVCPISVLIPYIGPKHVLRASHFRECPNESSWIYQDIWTEFTRIQKCSNVVSFKLHKNYNYFGTNAKLQLNKNDECQKEWNLATKHAVTDLAFVALAWIPLAAILSKSFLGFPHSQIKLRNSNLTETWLQISSCLSWKSDRRETSSLKQRI